MTFYDDIMFADLMKYDSIDTHHTSHNNHYQKGDLFQTPPGSFVSYFFFVVVVFMGCGAAEATGRGCVCFVVVVPRVLSANKS